MDLTYFVEVGIDTHCFVDKGFAEDIIYVRGYDKAIISLFKLSNGIKPVIL